MIGDLSTYYFDSVKSFDRSDAVFAQGYGQIAAYLARNLTIKTGEKSAQSFTRMRLSVCASVLNTFLRYGAAIFDPRQVPWHDRLAGRRGNLNGPWPPLRRG